MKVRKSAMTLLVLVLLGMMIVSGCRTVKIVEETPTAVALQPTPDATATYNAIATEIAATQTAQEGPTATPTPVPTPVEPDRVLNLTPADDIPNRCPIGGSQGMITYFSRAVGSLRGTIQLSGLEHDRSYVLTLNGWPDDHPTSNEILGSINCGSPYDCGFNDDGEGFWNFVRVPTDSEGNATDVSLNVPLPPLDYTVKFFVKDPTTPDWCIVLYNNSFKFSVQ